MRMDSPKCPNCGAPVDANAQKCLYCGASVVVASPAQSLPSGVRCPNCSQSNKEENVFCEFCGAKLLFACPHCGKPLSVGKTICPHCGTHISERLQQLIETYAQRRNYSEALYHAEVLRQFDIEGKYTERIVRLVRECRVQLSALYEAHTWTTARKQTQLTLESWKKPLIRRSGLIYAVTGVFKKEKGGLFGSTLFPPAEGLLVIDSSMRYLDIGFQIGEKQPHQQVGHSSEFPMPIITSLAVSESHSPSAKWPIEVFDDKLIVNHLRQGYRDVIFNMPKGSPQFILELLPRAMAQLQLGNIESLVSPIHPSVKYPGW